MTVGEGPRPRALSIGVSPTAAVEQKVAELQRAGRTLYRLGLGEPDFGVEPHVAAAAIASVDGGHTGYTETAGLRPLREAVAERLTADLGVPYAAESVIVAAGAKQAIANALAALCADGDEVLVTVPYWVSFPEQIRLAGAVPRFVKPVEGEIAATASEIEAAITARSRVLIVNSPNNPSGAVYGMDQLAAIADACQWHDLWVISDEVYRAFVFDENGHRSIASMSGMRERTIVIDSASKTYGMPGWRLGYAAGPVDVVRTMIALQSHTTSNPSSIAQAAAEAALRGPQDAVEAHRLEYADRSRWLADRLAAIPALRTVRPSAGGFFTWVDARGAFGIEIGGRRPNDADELATAVLDACDVVLTPGTGFGSRSHVRMSVAAPRAELAEGLDRLAAVLGS